MRSLYGMAAALALAAHTPSMAQSYDVDAPPADRSQIVLGDGDNSSIDIEGAKLHGATFTFKQVRIDRNGWLVMHPFENGEPKGTVYVGASYVPAGVNEDVAITVDPAPQPGEPYIVMLHYDMNDDQVFDFNDGITVPDAPVFEGNTMIAHRYEAPS